MGDTFSCQEAPFQPERHPRSLEQISMITPSKTLKGNFSLGFQRRSLRCFQGSRLSASTTQHTPFTDSEFSHSFRASPWSGTTREMIGQLTRQVRATQVQRGSSQFQHHCLSSGFQSMKCLVYGKSSSVTNFFILIFLLRVKQIDAESPACRLFSG